MTHEREKIAGTKAASLYRVEQRFNGRLVGKHYELQEYNPAGVDTTRYAAFIDCWAAYLSAVGWKDPGAGR